jgi:hypothetical protein
MAMYAMTVTGQWGASDGELFFARVACEFAAEGSVAALATAHDLLAALFAAPETQPLSLWLERQRPEATLTGVPAVHIRYVDAEDRAPLGFRCLLD